MIGPTSASTKSALSWANAISNHTRQASVCGPKPEPLQPGVAPCLATTLVVKYTRRCPDGPWSCCVTIVAFKFSALPFQGRPRTFFNSLITNLSSGGTRCNDLAFWDDVFACFHDSISDPNCLLVRMCACASITLSPNGNTWIVYAFPKTRANTILSSFLTVTLVKHHAACRINDAIKMLPLGNFLTKDYQMTTTSHHSVRIFNLALTLMAGSRTMSHQCSFDSSVLYNLQQLFQHGLLV